MSPRAQKLYRYRARCPFWAIDGAPVWYTPDPGSPETRFAAVIDGRPWFAIGGSAWFARLRDVRTAAGATTVTAAMVAELAPRREGPRA